MLVEDLTRLYSAKSDEELLRLASKLEELTQAAQTALAGELAKRRINVADGLKSPGDEESKPGVEQTEPRVAQPPRESPQVSRFVPEVLSFYHDHFWIFVKLIAPAIIIGYIAFFTLRYEGREIARHIPRGIGSLQHKTEMLEIFFVNQFGYLVSWLAFSLSFGAICSAVRQVGAAVIPVDSFAPVRARMGSFLRLSLLLYALLLALIATAGVLTVGVLWILSKYHPHPSPFTIKVVSFAAMGSALLVLSRFGLAIPALVLDNCGVAKAMLRSDELTEGTWLTLAALLFKSVVGGYIAGMCPFWLASFISRGVSFPSWFPWLLDAASVAAVIVVEPTMFIGFALLYLRMSENSNGKVPHQGSVAGSPVPPFSFMT